MTLWQRFIKENVQSASQYDIYSGESQVSKENMEMAGKIVKDLSISSDSDGAVAIDFASDSNKLVRW